MGSRDRAVPSVFESFDLSIERIGETYRAHVTDSPVGPRPPVEIDPDGLDVGGLPAQGSTKPTRDVRRRTVKRTDLRRVGERLFRTVFVAAVAEAFRASVEHVRGKGAGLRIQIRLDEASELATLPWEALWDPTLRAFLADQHDLPVVRSLGVTASAPVAEPMQPPLRLLALLPEPRGEDKLGGAAEWQQIQEHLAPLIEHGVLEAERLEPATLDALGSRVAKETCHVLHVVAHGGPGDPGAGGLLKLEDGSGGPDSVTGGDLARALERTAPRLVMLNACHGARAKVDDAFDGMAQHLLSRGVPAVVAMRTVISDAAATTFAAELYRYLAAGRSVEAAMVEARRTLSLGKHRAEWATPALYLRSANVRIFDGQPASGSVAADRGGSRRRLWAPLLTTAAGAAAIVATLTWPRTESEACPSPPGLEDLRFVEIDTGSIDLGDRKVTVEEAFCIATKEVSRRDWLTATGAELPRPEWPLEWPITSVTPEKVEAFLQNLEARDPRVRYRLPTAAEWEFAARAGGKTDYFFGDDPSQLHRYANCSNFLENDGHDGPAPIGFYKPNPWGLYDVHGNVAEWVQWPPDSDSPPDIESREQALRLGGSFESVPRNCSFSGSRREVLAGIDYRQETGFRVVRELGMKEE